ncbi:hypothetical protein PIB30_108542, partial [Stylosanthes scabra]|nr:hypothetical protein [Stylosanthes scabra]
MPVPIPNVLPSSRISDDQAQTLAVILSPYCVPLPFEHVTTTLTSIRSSRAAGSLGQAAFVLMFATRAASSLPPGAPPPVPSFVVPASSILTSRPFQLPLKIFTSQTVEG